MDGSREELGMVPSTAPPLAVPEKFPGEYVVGSLDWIATAAYGGREKMMELAWSLLAAEGQAADRRWRDMINLWLQWEERWKRGEMEYRPTLNQVVVALRLPVAEFVEWLAAGIGAISQLVARQKMAMELEGVIEATVEYAKMPEGHQDRKMLLQAQGVVPTGGGVNVNVNQQVAVTSRGKEEMKSPLLKFRETTEAIDEAVRAGEPIDAEIMED